MDADKQLRDFKGVWISREIWLDSRLSALEKIIFVEIDSLDNGEKGCFASNKYLADFCQCSERKVCDAISKLKEYGYIYVSSFDGRSRVLRSCLAKNASLAREKCEAETQKVRHNNIDNNKANNKVTKERKKEASTYDLIIAELVTDSSVKEALLEFIKMRKLIKKPLTDYALRRILSRLDELGGNNDKLKVDILNQSIVNNWQGLFPLKKDDNRYGAKPSDEDRFYKNDEEDDDDWLTEVYREGGKNEL